MKSAFYFTLIVLVVVVIGFVAFYSTASSSKSALEDQLTNATSQVSSVTDQLNAANTQVSSLEQENADLKATITPNKPIHNLSPEDITVSSTYWNLAWVGKDAQLQQTVRDVNTAYYQWHTYIANETDCNDMAVDIWDMLRKKGVISIIATGNLKLDNETFSQCNHAWLIILNSSGKTFALEPTNGQLYFKGDSIATQYMECFLYALPSDLRADLGTRW